MAVAITGSKDLVEPNGKAREERQVQMTDKDPMPFGKYRGVPMEDVPAKYLDWLIDQPWIGKWNDVVAYIEDNRMELNFELEHANG